MKRHKQKRTKLMAFAMACLQSRKQVHNIYSIYSKVLQTLALIGKIKLQTTCQTVQQASLSHTWSGGGKRGEIKCALWCWWNNYYRWFIMLLTNIYSAKLAVLLWHHNTHIILMKSLQIPRVPYYIDCTAPQYIPIMSLHLMFSNTRKKLAVHLYDFCIGRARN